MNRNLIVQTLLLSFLLVIVSCNKKKLPIYGKVAVVNERGVDSVDFKLSTFSFTDQEGKVISENDVKGKIVVADFFFTSCPSICPKMKKEMLRIYEKYNSGHDIQLLSFSIDPKRDTVERLKTYSQKLGIQDNLTWHFLTGEKDSIYMLAESLMIQAAEDADAAGGFVHNGKFVLFDRLGRIRGFYNGVDNKEVDNLLLDIDVLLNEKYE
jgi:protein SCO1/2